MDAARRLLAMAFVPVQDDRGAVATEYGLTLLLIAIVIIAGATLFGISLNELFVDGGESIPSP